MKQGSRQLLRAVTLAALVTASAGACGQILGIHPLEVGTGGSGGAPGKSDTSSSTSSSSHGGGPPATPSGSGGGTGGAPGTSSSTSTSSNASSTTSTSSSTSTSSTNSSSSTTSSGAGCAGGCDSPPSSCYAPTGTCKNGLCSYSPQTAGTLCVGGVCNSLGIREPPDAGALGASCVMSTDCAGGDCCCYEADASLGTCSITVLCGLGDTCQ